MKKRGRSFSPCIFLKNRRGSHVGVILSFVIFITFIVFLYSILSPAVDTGESKRTILEYIQRELLKNVSANFTSASVQITQNPTENCVKLMNILIIPEFNPPYLIIKNEEGIIQGSYSDYDLGLANLMIDRENSDNVFFKIYASKKFPILSDTPLNCKTVSDSDYNIGLIKLDNYVFEKEVYNLIDYYNTNYEKLKDELNIPSGNEFGFEFIKSDETRIGVETVEVSGEVYADEVPIQYVDDQANVLSGFINIKVW